MTQHVLIQTDELELSVTPPIVDDEDPTEPVDTLTLARFTEDDTVLEKIEGVDGVAAALAQALELYPRIQPGDTFLFAATTFAVTSDRHVAVQ